MSTQPVENIVIVGTGCAGLTAAIYAARAGLNPLVIEGAQPGGQLTTTSEVENFPGFPEGVDGYELMSSLRKQAARFGARFLSASVEGVDFSISPHVLRTGAEPVLARAVIIATGASARLLGIPGEAEFYGGRGVTTCATCDGAFYRGMDVVVVGGGDSACEEALFLTRFCSSVTLIHRRDTLRASKIMSDRIVSHPKIRVLWDSIPVAVTGTPEQGVQAVRVRNVKTGAESQVPCRGVFIAIGHKPNTGPFAPPLKVDEAGYFLPEPGSQVRTSIPGVFVAGDCADHVYRQAITAAGMGCQAAILAGRWLAEQGA